MSEGLTKKQKGFVKDIARTGNATRASLNNYDIKSKNKENVAGVIGNENLRKPKIKEALKPILEQYEKELQDILKAMALKNKDTEQYQVLVKAADTVQKQIQLLGGNPTENVGITGCEIRTFKDES